MSTTHKPGRIKSSWEALQARLAQTAETVTRNSRIDIAGGNVDDIDPPEDIDEYHQLYRDIGIIRANINQFVRDVTMPGVRIQADSEPTEAYFMGGDGAPSDTPEGGFLENCAVISGEKHQPFYPFLASTVVQRWTRGTVLVEYLKSESENAESPITGFKHIRPETVSARTYANTNVLIDPDDLENATETTKRDEAAAYVQFDENSILGRRGRLGDNRTEIPLSQNDVLKQTLDPDIGGDERTEEGVFGTSIMEAVSDDAEEYQEIKRDRAVSIKTKAYGVWGAQFNTDVTEAGDEIIVTDWDDDEQDDWINNLNEIGPGDVIGYDGSIEFDKFEGEVPELESTLQHYVDDILAPLPAPKYATAHGEQITQHVTDRQETAYQDLIHEERQYQQRSWRQAFREIAERHPELDPSGIDVKIEPEEEESPIMSLDDDVVDRLNAYTEAVERVEMSTLLTDEEKRELLLQLPDTPEIGSLEEADLDESDPNVQEQMGNLEGALGDD